MKRVLSLILSVCMCITCLAVMPMGAAAEDTAPVTTVRYFLDMSGMKASYTDTAGTGSVTTTVQEKVQQTNENGPVVDENGDPVYDTVSKTVVGAFLNKETTVPAHEEEDSEGNVTIVPEKVSSEPCAFEESLANYTFTVESDGVISDVKEDGSFDILKSGIAKITANYKNGDITATASCFITVAETNRLYAKVNNAGQGADPYYGSARTVTVPGNNTYNALNSFGWVLGEKTNNIYSITMPKTYVISEWDYDNGIGKGFTSMLERELTGNGINLTVTASTDDEYYWTRSFLENSRSTVATGKARYTETNVKRSQGWHQVTAVIEPGTEKDDARTAHVTLYIDGQEVLSYENVISETAIGSEYKVQNLTSGRHVTGVCIARCETSSAAVKAAYPTADATDVPVYSDFGIAFNGTVTDGYADSISVAKADGTAVSFEASLNVNKNKVKLNMGKLDPQTKYTVTVTNLPVQYKKLTYTYDSKSKKYIQSSETLTENVSGTYSFTTGEEKTDKLGTALKAMTEQKYSMDYMRYADFTQNNENPAELDKALNDRHIKINYPGKVTAATAAENGVVTKIKDGVLSVDFAANAKKGGTIGFYDLDSFKDYTSSDVVVASYKYKVRGDLDAIGVNSLSPYGSLMHIATNGFKNANEICGVSLGNSFNNGGNENGFMGSINYGYSGGYVRTKLVAPKDLKTGDWIELTYVIEYNDGAQGTSGRKIKKATIYGPSGTFECDFTSKGGDLLSKNLRMLSHSMSAGGSTAVGFDFKDFAVYGFERPIPSTLSLNVTNADDTAVNPDSALGEVKLSFSAAMGEAMTADVILAVKEKDSNKLVGCMVNNRVEFNAAEAKTVEETFNLGTEPGAYSFEAYVWNSVTGLVPQYPVTVYTYTAPAN